MDVEKKIPIEFKELGKVSWVLYATMDRGLSKNFC